MSSVLCFQRSSEAQKPKEIASKIPNIVLDRRGVTIALFHDTIRIAILGHDTIRITICISWILKKQKNEVSVMLWIT